jgi:hypothetical protein
MIFSAAGMEEFFPFMHPLGLMVQYPENKTFKKTEYGNSILQIIQAWAGSGVALLCPY